MAKGKCGGRESASCAGETAQDWGEQVPVTLGREHLDLCRGKGALGLGRSRRESHHGTARQPEQWAGHYCVPLAEPGSNWPHCPELQCPKPIPAPVPWSLHQGAELTPQHWLHWSMVCSDWNTGTLGTGAGQGTGSSPASESWSPITPAQGLQTETTFLHTFPVICCPGTGPRVGWVCTLQLGPGPFLANHPACCRPAALQHQQSLALHPFSACPKLCGYTCSAPCLPLASPGELPTSQHPLLANSSPLFAWCPAPHSPLPLSPAAAQPRCPQTDAAAPAPLVWVRMTRPLSPGGSLLPAGAETSAAVSPPIPAANNT